MGQVIDFKCETRHRALLARHTGEAQILFFLGVRYCRQESLRVADGARTDGGKDNDPRGPAARPGGKKRA
ncbi:hypothetical protein CCR94_13175 [Rhodoblastus sphagnicola]|uniref:Uncharacterized protein n=1 Tax=Rhodoblastus sphagnicola TaxID=333368 RepID=A0A2S6N6M9_9HYPH|nr:hypothetical protein [Rhodoblastus sphagnicola]MBB4197624.1 hypothetical protein [Rhodoblastus sphagnicola]PPQ30268.1 hypothetical protein CCR94_13175 [Rhodoblastus sphagnicola]